MVDYNERSSEDDVIRYLERISGPSLAKFEDSLSHIHNFYTMIGIKKSVPEIKKTITYLESSKKELVKKIVSYIEKSDSWGWIRNTHPEMAELNEETKTETIRTEFQLQHYFEFVDRRIAWLNRTIRLINDFRFHPEDKQKRIQPHTLVVLTWLLAFKKIGLSDKSSFAEVKALLKWFSRNRRKMLIEYFGRFIHISKTTIRRDYERYIQKPTTKTESYKELAETLYSKSFLELLD